MAGQLPDGALYIVMEYLDGLSLQSALAAADGAVPLPRAIHVALQICDAVGEAHAQGITHRDLKPENVMLVSRGADADFVKVLDFGIARLDWGEQSMATAAGLVFGTARYISPEGAQGEPVGPRGDVYSIATLVYQMLAGRTPFEGDQAVGILVQQIHDAPPPLKSIARSSYVPDALAAVIDANLAKDKSKRAPDARALGRALLDAAKAAGLSPEDLVPRSILLGARAPGPVQLQSMQRTKQLQLDKPVDDLIAEKAAAAAAGGRVQTHTEIAESEPLRTAYEVPAAPISQSQLPRVTVKTPPPSGPSLAGTAGPANATQKWNPPAHVRAQMETPPPSSVDATMDDASGQPPHAFDSTVRMSPQSAPRLPPTVIEDAGSPDAEPAEAPGWSRTVLVVVCFLVGIGVTAGVAFRMKLLGGSAVPALADDVSGRTRAAQVAAPAPAEPARAAMPPPPLAVLDPLFDAGLAAPGSKAPRRGRSDAPPPRPARADAGAPPQLPPPEATTPAPSASVKWL
jgi:serine/threonine-protein kinase